jgi:hypothetical protein
MQTVVTAGALLLSEGSAIAEEHLDLFGAISFSVNQNVYRPPKGLETDVVLQHIFAAPGTLDAVQIGRQRQAPPAHFQELLIENLLGVTHGCDCISANKFCEFP